MQLKTIKSVLRKKVNDLLSSIEDSKTKELCSKNIIVTGGAISSMLMKETVKDFDIYFRNEETVDAIIDYYLKIFNKDKDNNVEKKRKKDGRLSLFIRSTGITLEEGLEEGTEFFDNEEEIKSYVGEEEKEEEKDKKKYRPVFLTENAITLSDKVQLIIRFFGPPEEIHKNFDFIHCTCYYDYYSGELVTPVRALISILEKRLFYQGSLYPICSVLRARNLIKKDWAISGGQYLKMCIQISQLDLTSVDVLEEQLIGVDSAYFQHLIKHIREAKEKNSDLKIDVTYICSIIDEIL